MRLSARRFVAAAIVVAAGLSLVGCVGIPRSGEVQQGQEFSSDDDEIDVIFQPSRPVDGASQQDILNGFIRAALNPQKDFDVAKAFLSSSLAATWQPDAGVTIDQSARQIVPLSDSSMELRLTPVAQVGANGEYAVVQSSAPVTRAYSFVKEDGQWRISAAPDGIVMLASEFTEVYKSYALYFFDPSFSRLVPDLRWFPRVSSTTGTRIVRALLNGPATWLAGGAVVTAFPEGTGVTSVPIEGGTARVDLSGPVLDTTAMSVQRMQFQLEASLLGDLNGVSTVQMTVDQNEVPVATQGGAAPSKGPRVDARALVVRDGALGYYSGGTLTPIDGISDEVAKMSATSVSYSAGLGQAAVGTPTGVFIVAPNLAPGLVDDRANLIAPSIDPEGFIWTVPHDSPQIVKVSSPGRNPSSFTATWDGATDIVSLEVSRDGARVLAFVSSHGVPKLLVASVLRDKDGTPMGVGEPVELAIGAGTAVDATWVDALTIASVTLTPGGDNAVVLQQLGGVTTSLADAMGVVSIVGSNDAIGLRLLTADGSIQQQSASSWQDRAGKVSILATQE